MFSGIFHCFQTVASLLKRSDWENCWIGTQSSTRSTRHSYRWHSSLRGRISKSRLGVTCDLRMRRTVRWVNCFMNQSLRLVWGMSASGEEEWKCFCKKTKWERKKHWHFELILSSCQVSNRHSSKHCSSRSDVAY